MYGKCGIPIFSTYEKNWYIYNNVMWLINTMLHGIRMQIFSVEFYYEILFQSEVIQIFLHPGDMSYYENRNYNFLHQVVSFYLYYKTQWITLYLFSLPLQAMWTPAVTCMHIVYGVAYLYFSPRYLYRNFAVTAF